MQAIAYIRTSSAANVGEDKDSHKRQLTAISVYAKKRSWTLLPAPLGGPVQI